jgi:hypothetical protein
MLSVYIHNGCIPDAHNSKILTGLSDLSAQRRIDLKISKGYFPDRVNNLNLDRFTFWARVVDTESGLTRDICFDMQDSAGFHYPEMLEACDIYFKRSYRQENIARLAGPLREKVRPYGLNFACSSPCSKFDFHLRLSSLLEGRPISPKSKLKQMHTLYISYMRNWFPRFKEATSYFHIPPFPSLFESIPNGSAPPRIIFQTRAWDPRHQKWLSQAALRQLNDSRAETIRALRLEFGDAVIAGLKDESFAREHYPDCIASQNTDKTSYLRLLRDSTICVQTTGLYGSSGWKLAEYFAAGKCIVTEPILDILPAPLQEGKHILTFTNPQQCVSHCRYLLDNPESAMRMANENFLYYLSEVEPSAHIYKCLTTRAFGDLPPIDDSCTESLPPH